MACVTSISTPNFSNSKIITKYSSPSASSSSLTDNRLKLRTLRRTVTDRDRLGAVRAAASSSESITATEKLGISIITNPPESKLTDLGVRSWPKWGCPPSKFPWTYSSRETCFLLKGKVKIFPDGSDDKDRVEITAGDLVVFPAGMSCTWDVSETVDKHYKFD